MDDRMIDRVCLYLAGELSAEEKRAFESELATNARLKALLGQMERLDATLADLPELKPSSAFTYRVLEKTVREPVGLLDGWTWLDWMKGLAPALAIGLIAVLWGKDLWAKTQGAFGEGAGAMDSVLGVKLFADQPFMLLGLLLPAAILAVAYFSLTNRCCMER
ncbi:hypothetical protein IT157_10710 [bacterium]|nr:hypothetical protein [bacterium]